VDGVAPEALAEEHVPVGLPPLVHVLLHDLSNLHSVRLEVVLLQCLLGYLDGVLKHVVGHVSGPVNLGSLK